MAGHSHWAGIKHKKALVDSKRGKLWSKLSKAIIVAAKTGGGDPATNLPLRYAIDAAKAVSMPKDNIERAIKKGTGELAGGELEAVIYEGYGPGGAAILCEVLTDNRNRTASEIRKLFDMAGGKLGATNCVAWMFETKGLFLIDRSAIGEDDLLRIALEAGAEDVRTLDDKYEVTCDPSDFQEVKQALAEHSLTPEVAEITRLPTNTVDLDVETARKVVKLLEKLDEHDDVQSVSTNCNIPQEVMAD